MRSPLPAGDGGIIGGSLSLSIRQPRRRDHHSHRHHHHHHNKHKSSMASGRDRDHPIELDDAASDSDNSLQVQTPRHHRRHGKDSTPKRASTTRDSFLKEPRPTLSPPLSREPHILDENSPRSKHRRTHRERRTSHERRRSKHLDPRPGPGETMVHQVPAVGQAPLQGPLLPLNPQPPPPLNFEGGPDVVNHAPYPHQGYPLPDLGLEDPDFNERFWGEYLANNDQFPEDALGQGALEQDPFNEYYFPEDANFNHAPPIGQLPEFGQAPVVENEITNQRVPLSLTPSTDDDVQYVRDVAVSGDDQLQEDSCLAKILEILPDINQDHVRTLYHERRAQDFKYSAIRNGRARYDPTEHLIQQIMEKPSYPKQRDAKRKRISSPDANQEEDEKWGAGDGPRDKEYLDAARLILQEEYPQVPHSFIKDQLADKRSLYQVYLAVAEAEGTFSFTHRLYDRLKNPRKSKLFPQGKESDDMADRVYQTYGPAELLSELRAARLARKKVEKSAQAEKDAEEAEAVNEREHQEANAMMECKCCFGDAPINRTAYCDGEEPHFFCFDCVKTHAATEIGKMHGKLKCMDGSLCTGIFSMHQLTLALDPKTLTTLERLQQQEEIRLAGFEGLADCPFCDFKAIYPPIEIDREFRCGNPECMTISCRLCDEETHIPRSCEENKKERHLPARHAIEEAMTDALVRTCPKCKAKIVKESGCNKMTCTRCYALMCYICRKDITTEQYNHFNKPNSKCAVYDQNTEKLHNDDVAAAEKTALEKAKMENPDIPEEDLKIKMKEEPKKTLHPLTEQMMQAYAIPGHPNMLGVMANGVPMPIHPGLHGFGVQGPQPLPNQNAQGLPGARVQYPPAPPRGRVPPYRGVDQMPEFYHHQPNQRNPQPDQADYYPLPVARGRFPVVPQMPGQFGDVIHDPPLDGRMRDGRGEQRRGNVPPFLPLGPDPELTAEIARLRAEAGGDRTRNQNPRRTDYLAPPRNLRAFEQRLTQFVEGERRGEHVEMDLAARVDRHGMGDVAINDPPRQANQDFMDNLMRREARVARDRAADAADDRAAEERLGLRRAQTERVRRRYL